MYISKKQLALSSRLPVLVLVTAWTLSSCSGLSDSFTVGTEPSIDLTPATVVGAIAGSNINEDQSAEDVSKLVSGEARDRDANESIPVRTRVLSVESHWGGTNVFAKQIGDELWTATSESSAQAESSL